MGVKTIDLFHHKMYIYGKTAEKNLKENHNIFDKSLYTSMSIEEYFEIIDDCIRYTDNDTQPHTVNQIIKMTTTRY